MMFASAASKLFINSVLILCIVNQAQSQQFQQNQGQNKLNQRLQQYEQVTKSNQQKNQQSLRGKQLQQRQLQIENEPSKDLWAVIHVGPMKTGSSVIQESFPTVSNELILDEYEEASQAMSKGIETNHMIGCFRPDAVKYTGGPNFELSCHPNALKQLKQVADRQHNLIISADYLTDPKTDLVKLKEFLAPWKNHKVVAYYRRYYDWLVSFHHQMYKRHSPETRVPISDFLEVEAEHGYLYKTMYLVDAMDRWRQYFPYIEIINLYELPNNDIAQSFYCKGLVGGSNTCNKYTEAQVSDPAPYEKEIEPLIYSDLAYFAKKQGLWNEATTGLTERSVARLAQIYQEQTLNRTVTDFGPAVVCPERWVIDSLLKKSLQLEEQVFPTYFFFHGEREVIADVKATKKSKMCNVDAEIVLDEYEEWQAFFSHLNRLVPKRS
jgi:hypothetical protein